MGDKNERRGGLNSANELGSYSTKVETGNTSDIPQGSGNSIPPQKKYSKTKYIKTKQSKTKQSNAKQRKAKQSVLA